MSFSPEHSCFFMFYFPKGSIDNPLVFKENFYRRLNTKIDTVLGENLRLFITRNEESTIVITAFENMQLGMKIQWIRQKIAFPLFITKCIRKYLGKWSLKFIKPKRVLWDRKSNAFRKFLQIVDVRWQKFIQGNSISLKRRRGRRTDEKAAISLFTEVVREWMNLF